MAGGSGLSNIVSVSRIAVSPGAKTRSCSRAGRISDNIGRNRATRQRFADVDVDKPRPWRRLDVNRSRNAEPAGDATEVLHPPAALLQRPRLLSGRPRRD